MDPLKELFKDVALDRFQEVRAMLKEHGDKKIDEVKLSQAYGGMRGIKSMIWETSNLDPVEGIRFRGYTIPELQKLLPTGNGNEPLPEGLFWLMLTGKIPNATNVDWLTNEWHNRGELPKQTRKVLQAMPDTTHPMTLFSMGITSMAEDSVFVKRYAEGMRKSEYWDAYYEDSMTLIARLPYLAAHIYRKLFKKGQYIDPDKRLDWASNFAHMLGYKSADFQDLMRMYLTIHADHEGGNASAHTVHLVGSTLSNPYLALAAGMNALAGPLHGRANQEVIEWIFNMVGYLGTDTPTEAQVRSFVEKTIESGRVIPGYGHAVLRRPDPRFTAQQKFAEKYIKDDNIVNIVKQLFNVVPDVLKGLGKVKNPWPNVDAHSGAILVHYGLNEYSYYTVLFGVSRALGVLAAGTWSRALGMPLERPKSLTTEWVKENIL